ncbi:hypothetical protein L596_027394 [Steinernema carpocapsae]|uniref:Uncharacterized protein n=1 Tax=Steinernema carpocapsae TaxID=34508 RepID=A0A4U5M4C6_STECR|nr:hypothetical protein L596_027394 [Steinernema carpocapsae]
MAGKNSGVPTQSKPYQRRFIRVAVTQDVINDGIIAVYDLQGISQYLGGAAKRSFKNQNIKICTLHLKLKVANKCLLRTLTFSFFFDLPFKISFTSASTCKQPTYALSRV